MLNYVNHAKHNYIMWVKFKPCFKFKQVLHIPPSPQAAVLNLWLDTLSVGTGHEIFLFKVLPGFSYISHASVPRPGSGVLPAVSHVYVPNQRCLLY